MQVYIYVYPRYTQAIHEWEKAQAKVSGLRGFRKGEAADYYFGDSHFIYTYTDNFQDGKAYPQGSKVFLRYPHALEVIGTLSGRFNVISEGE